jgi:hypothetical protein
MRIVESHEIDGLTCFVIRYDRHDGPHYCGYVRIPPGHPWYRMESHEIPDDGGVYGGITFTGRREKNSNSWYVGFDLLWDEGRNDNPNFAMTEVLKLGLAAARATHNSQ